MYTSKNNHKQKPQSLDIRVTTASKQRLTLRQASLIPTIRSMVLPEDYLLKTFVLYVETNTALTEIIAQKESVIILIEIHSSMTETLISHRGMRITSMALILSKINT